MPPKRSPGDEKSSGFADEAETRRGPNLVRGLIGTVSVFVCIPFVAIAFATLTGIGLNQDLAGHIAITGAIMIVLLPGIGLTALLGGSGAATGVAFAFWSLAVLNALPSYFPGQREDAARIGTAYFTASFGQSARASATDRTVALLGWLSDDRPPLARAQRHDEDTVPELPADPLASDGARNDEPNTTWIPYQGRGQSLLIPAHIDGPDFGEELQFVFDTGATLTTLSRPALELVGIPVPSDAPKVMLRTAGGELEAQLVLVDALWLEDELVEWVTIAVCEHCSNEAADGLLGLNVSSHYRVSIDHETEEIEFVPRRGRRNRKLDVQPWLELNSVLTRWDDGRLELTVEARNLARRGIKSSVLEVRCANENFSVRLDPIPARGYLEQPASLPWGTECDRFEVQVIAAAWELDRI